MNSKGRDNGSLKDYGIPLSSNILILLQAIKNVDKEYLSYANTNSNADDRNDVVNQLERVFAYELYHQWSLLKDESYVLNGEIGKVWTNDCWYPDMVLHGGQSDPNNNKIVVEIKRECMVKNNPKAIIEDLIKLSQFLDSVERNSQNNKFRNYEDAVFILLKGNLREISRALNNKDLLSGIRLNDNIICLTYNEKKEIRIALIKDLK